MIHDKYTSKRWRRFNWYKKNKFVSNRSSFTLSNIEHVFIQLKLNNTLNLIIGFCYIPQIACYLFILNTLKQLKKSTSFNVKFILSFDYNLPNVSFSNSSDGFIFILYVQLNINMVFLVKSLYKSIYVICGDNHNMVYIYIYYMVFLSQKLSRYASIFCPSSFFFLRSGGGLRYLWSLWIESLNKS